MSHGRTNFIWIEQKFSVLGQYSYFIFYRTKSRTKIPVTGPTVTVWESRDVAGGLTEFDIRSTSNLSLAFNKLHNDQSPDSSIRTVNP